MRAALGADAGSSEGRPGILHQEESEMASQKTRVDHEHITEEQIMLT